MKKTMVSLATATLIATSGMAADTAKGIDFVTTGEATVYYQTSNGGTDSLFSKDASGANFGVQLNGNADIGNGFALGTQLTFLGTSGLETSAVSTVQQNTINAGNALNNNDDALALTQINLTKTIGNTIVKLGRQELPKSLSPLAFSEGWNVYKNTFDAAVIINSDISGLTLVGAAVGTSNSSVNIGNWSPLTAAGTTVAGAYMLTAQTTLVPGATLTGSYYRLGEVDTESLAPTLTNDRATAMWVDAKTSAKDLPLGLKIGVQYGTITPDNTDLDPTTAMGAKVGLAPVNGVNLCLAYSSVNDGAVALKNTGTGVKTPLYTQLILNQNHIASDNSTVMVQASVDLGGTSKLIARIAKTTDNANDNSDFTDSELIYKVKTGGVDLLAAYLNIADDAVTDTNHVVRVVARYNF